MIHLPGGLLVVDSATSHAARIAPPVALLDAREDFETGVATVGKGELLALKRGAPLRER